MACSSQPTLIIAIMKNLYLVTLAALLTFAGHRRCQAYTVSIEMCSDCPMNTKKVWMCKSGTYTFINYASYPGCGDKETIGYMLCVQGAKCDKMLSNASQCPEYGWHEGSCAT